MSQAPSRKVSLAQEVERPPLGRLWQLPTFVVGVAVFALTWWMLPAPPPEPATLFERALSEGFAALDCGDADLALARGQDAFHWLDASADRSGDVRFLLGSAHLLQAAQTAGERQAESARKARVYLQQAKQLGVAEAYEPRLPFRLALARHYAGGLPEEVIEEIEKALRHSPADREEGYRLLVGLHLRKSSPDLGSALRACERLLALPALSRPNAVRLQQADLLLRLERPDEARQALARILPSSAENPQSMHLRALSYFHERQWASAAALWEDAELRKLPALGTPLYYLGHCYLRLGRPDDARRTWERVAREFPGSDEELAASVRLAELHFQDDRDAEALAGWEALLLRVTPGLHNPHLDVQAVRGLIEAHGRAWVKKGRYEEARRLATASRNLFGPGEAEHRFAQASESAGLAAFDRSNRAAGAEAEKLLEDARRFCLEAAEAFETVARLRTGRPEHAELLWAAAANFLRAQQYTRGAAVLERYLTLDIPQKKRIEALVGLGEAQQALKQNDRAVKLLKQALTQDGPLSFRTRYLLALAQIEQGKLDDAERTLRENLSAPVTGPEPAEFSQSLFALAHLLYRKGKYDESASYFERAIDRYPDDPQTLQARYLLAEAHRKAARLFARDAGKADTAMARDLYQKHHRQRLELALGQFRQLAFILTDRQEKSELSAVEGELLREGRFGIGECLFNLGRYDEAIGAYEALAENYRGRPESLTALMHLTRCYFTVKRAGDARSAVERARAALDQLDDQTLKTTQISRKEWQDWLDAAAKSFR